MQTFVTAIKLCFLSSMQARVLLILCAFKRYLLAEVLAESVRMRICAHTTTYVGW